MSSIYDNWERLVEAVLKREELRRLALCESLSSSISADFNSRFSLGSSHGDVSESRISIGTISPRALSGTSRIFDRELPRIELKEIKKATKNFNHNLIIGEGVFGTVYKGWIDEQTLTASKRGSGTAVAVKKWKQNYFLGHEEYLNEIYYLSQLHHPNLVRLIGFHDENFILVYEFIPNGSLNTHLFRVAIGAARGLSFLHDTKIQVIHRGCKSGGILLDGEFNAKLSNFDIARSDGPTGAMAHVSNQVNCRYEYAAPEYVLRGRLTAKCDVYDFGVVLLELLSGRRVLDNNRALEEQHLVEWAKPYLDNKRKLLQVVDPTLQGQYTHNAVYAIAALALQCINFDPEQRPQMAEVLVALEQLQGP